MSDEVLLRFLRNGLVDVGGDDAKFEKLQGTAGDLAAALKKMPSKTASFSLVAFDPDAPSNDPVILEAVEALKKRWPTYVNTFAGTPVAVVRAMLLDALVQAARADDKVGVAFVTSARNALPLMEAGDERAIWADVVGEIERQVDVRAEAEWATPSSITVAPMNLDVLPSVTLKVSSARANRDSLKQQVLAASGPQYHTPAGNVPTNGNPHWPHQHPPNWSAEFSTRLTDAISDVVDAVAAKVSVGPVDVTGPLQQLATAVSAHVDSTLNAVSGATAGLQRRTNLLWWKETLFSPTARVSYRELSRTGAAALMAFDLHQLVPIFSPASVAAFLHECVLSLPRVEGPEERTIRELLDEVRDIPSLGGLRAAAAELVAEPAGRGPLLGLIGHRAARPTLDSKTFRDLVGVPVDTALTPGAWATWIFRELQAARAANGGSGAKRRTRKGGAG